MKKQIELTLNQNEIAIIQRALISYQKELADKMKKYEQMDTEKYTITEAGKNELIMKWEATNRNISYLFQEITDRTNEAHAE